MEREESTTRASGANASNPSMTDQAELLRRMRRATNQIREQHEQIAPLFADLDAMLRGGRLRDAQTTSFSVQGALRAHFLLEEQIVFPVLGALSPERSSDFAALAGDHASLESTFAAFIDQILIAALAAAEETLEAFNSALLEHEKREEALLQAAIGAES